MEFHSLIEMFSKMFSLYGRAVTATCQKYGINRTSFDILVFLKNNPEHDTARAIEEKRGIKKSMASIAIDKLCQTGYLCRYPDKTDRRIQHLVLTEKSGEITGIGLRLQNAFFDRMLGTLNADEKAAYIATSEKLIAALRDMDKEESII